MSNENTSAPTHVTESLADKRKQRELAEARQSGAAAPAIDVQTGDMINPHNPEFITRRPWYLGGGDTGPSLDHQADQRAVEDRVGISLAASEALLAEERRRVKEELRQAKSGKLNVGLWVEALKYNRKPYLMCQVIRVKKKSSGVQEVDLKYEDGSIEKKVKVIPGSKRVKGTKTGARCFEIDHSIVGKSTYDSKRDAWHGFETSAFTKINAEKFQQRDAVRRRIREQQEKEKDEKDVNGKNSTKDKIQNNASDSDSDYDSDDGGSSDDEFVQKDEDDKMFTSRLARQGGVGGAQMKVTARNLRIREDTAKYLRNLDVNSAYYDPKSRSMRDNPNPEMSKEDALFVGDNFARVSGDAIGLADTQLFAWEASNKGVQQIHPQANPSQAELLKKEFNEKASDLKAKQKRAVLEKYGGAEYLDGSDGLGSSNTIAQQLDSSETRNDRKVRFGEKHETEQYTREGRMIKGTKLRIDQKSKYEEDVFINGHTVVWGSYFHKGAFRWGYADDHTLMKNSYYTGENGRIANDEANEMRYGTGIRGSAALAQARNMLKIVPSSERSSSSSVPYNSSALYGEADMNAKLDKEKVQAAKEALKAGNEEKNGKKRKYNSVDADVDVSAEDMEAWRLTRGRSDDPMNKITSEELIDYKQ